MQYLFVITLFLGLAIARPPFLGKALNPQAGNTIKSWELAQFHLEPFNLTDMAVGCTKTNMSSSLFGCSIQFKWDDPNANQSCTCKEDWQWNGITHTQGPMNNYSTDYSICKNDDTEIFQFKFIDVFDLSNFSLSLTHIYKDNKYNRYTPRYRVELTSSNFRNFPTPTTANMFSQTNITLDLIEKSNTTMAYSSACDCPIKANITGMTI
ncbi:uncharacterized protein F4807DRAFT_457821 [Annulohypoxylon truncatum]|uniref:uncharacterized protein n=1 Tax=Annulohypoxylon truncatum TaxID=327061 RepID=UPI002007B860|nr:uncharacterized protein F4807DRAFT_457821 [Annulohypoxylon truncatum]KAI1212322.1 hypothetical protein F4807DRAFT_457821 [Annulohypoxylon truncatum]